MGGIYVLGTGERGERCLYSEDGRRVVCGMRAIVDYVESRGGGEILVVEPVEVSVPLTVELVDVLEWIGREVERYVEEAYRKCVEVGRGALRPYLCARTIVDEIAERLREMAREWEASRGRRG